MSAIAPEEHRRPRPKAGILEIEPYVGGKSKAFDLPPARGMNRRWLRRRAPSRCKRKRIRRR